MPTTVKIKVTKNDMVYFLIKGIYSTLSVFVYRDEKNKPLVMHLPNYKKEFINFAPLRDAIYIIELELDGDRYSFAVERKRQ